MVGAVGGGIFAKTAKTPPLQSALRGYQCATRRAMSLQMPAPHMRVRAPPPPYAHTVRPACLPSRRPYGFHNDAARRVATIFEKWDCRLEPIYKEIPIKKD